MPQKPTYRPRLRKVSAQVPGSQGISRREKHPKDEASKSWPHDVIRSVGVVVTGVLAVISIGLASTSLWLQLTPKAERILIEDPSLVATNDPLQTRRVGPLPSGSNSLVGPFVWRVTIANESDRAVSLIDMETRLEDERAGVYMVSGESDGAFRENDKVAVFPFVVPAYESRALLVRGYLPGFLTLEAQAKCLSKDTTVTEFNRCAVTTGTDIFGNKLHLIRDGSRVLGEMWPAPMYQPSLVLRFSSSTGKLWTTKATAYPVAMPVRKPNVSQLAPS